MIRGQLVEHRLRAHGLGGAYGSTPEAVVAMGMRDRLEHAASRLAQFYGVPVDIEVSRF